MNLLEKGGFPFSSLCQNLRKQFQPLVFERLIGRGMSILDSISSTTRALGRGGVTQGCWFLARHMAHTQLLGYGITRNRNNLRWLSQRWTSPTSSVNIQMQRYHVCFLFMYTGSVSIFGFHQATSCNVFSCDYIYTLDTWYDVIWLRLNLVYFKPIN